MIQKHALFTLFFYSSLVLPCIHADREFQSELSENSKEGLLYHDGKHAHLIVRTEIQNKDGGALPSKLAWVIPLPSLPIRYKTEDPRLFKELHALSPKARSKSLSLGERIFGTKTAKIVVHDAVKVDNYTVTPIEIKSKKAGSALNRWLKKNGFGTVKPALQKYYLKKGAAFVAVKLDKLKGKSALEIKPLHIVYKSQNPKFPLKFSTHSGEFALNLWILSSERIKSPHQTNPFYKQGLGIASQFDYPSEHGKSPVLDKLLKGLKGTFVRVGGKVNTADLPLSDWESDIGLPIRVAKASEIKAWRKKRFKAPSQSKPLERKNIWFEKSQLESWTKRVDVALTHARIVPAPGDSFRIIQIVNQSQWDEMGLQNGDLITHINGKTANSNKMALFKIDEIKTLRVSRGSRAIEYTYKVKP